MRRLLDKRTVDWTNRVEVVDGFIKRRQLTNAREFALQILNTKDVEHMLTELEIEYLQLVVSLDTLEDFINKRKNKDD